MFKFISNSFGKIFGTKADRDMKEYGPRVPLINEEYEKLKSLSNDDLRNKTLEFKSRIADYLSEIDTDINNLKSEIEAEQDFGIKEELFEELDKITKERDKALEEILLEILPEAFAVVKETAFRFTNNETISTTATDQDRALAVNKNYVSIEGNQAIWKNEWDAAGGHIKWNMIHYDVQLIGGMVLHAGKIAEMATGEGKTLVATLPAYLNGIAGQGVHIITVNNYLARRDCEWVGPIFEFLHLTIDCIDKYKPHSPGRKKAYECDITYGTNNEFGFDYLRDNMVRSMDEVVQSKHHFSMIDEVDSVLIDDARTPLIISGPVAQGAEANEYNELKPKVDNLVNAQKKLATQYLAEAKKLFKEGVLGVEEGEAGMSLLRAHHALPKNRPLIKFIGQEGVKAMLEKTENHYMAEQSKNMHLVDDELYFVIDEKNRQVDLTEKGVEYLSRGQSDGDFFVLPNITEETMMIEEDDSLTESEKQEKKSTLIQDYTEKTQRLHSVSQLLKAYTLFERDSEYIVMEGQVKIVDEQTGRMMEGRRYSDGLHQALEAKENVKVGEITQTYATVTLQNFFRMYHKLAGMTGTAETEASEFWEIYKMDVVVIPTNRPIARDDRDDLVYRTEREKYNAVIDEIDKLTAAGRPVLVGTTGVDISEKLSRMLNLRKIPHNVLNAKQHQREAQVVAEAGLPGKVTIATNMAGRGTDIKLSDEVKASGGLAIIGTERHDSRRVDRQLRGRAGRQGDPGSSQFFVSLEDKLMRLFHSEKITKVMDRIGYSDGEVIQHPMITKSIERAQKRVEENNFGVRKRLLEYDDVMNIQREAIYKKRNNALTGERLSVDLNNMFLDLSHELVAIYQNNNDFVGFKNDALRYFAVDTDIEEVDFKEASHEEITEQFQKEIFENYNKKSAGIGNELIERIREIYTNEGDRYKYVALPFTDGRKKGLSISADIKKAVETDGKSIMSDIEKAVTLSLVDDSWKHHLRSMDELKESVQAASFEQKDPLVVYKTEAYDLFEILVRMINRDVASFLCGGKLLFQREDQGLQQARRQKTDMSKVKTSRQGLPQGVSANQGNSKPQTVVRTERKVGRNDPCPCGSGKKYKKCHGK